MPPVDGDVLLLVKYFIFLTCVFFWIKLAYDAMKRGSRTHSRHRREDEE